MTALLDVALKTALLTLVALAAAAALRRRSASLRHCVLATALVGSLCLPLIGLVLPAWSVQVPSAWLGGSVAVSQRWLSEPVAASAQGRVMPGGDPSPSARTQVIMALPFLTTAVWLGGALLGICVLGAGILRLRRIARHADPVGTGPMRVIADELSRTYGIRRPVRLLRCQEQTLIATCGTWRPTIFLPRGSMEWSTERIEVVLRHELAHVRRRDWLVTMVASLVRALYWFNPMLWITHRRLRDEAERASDDLVLRSGVNGAEYAAHLLGVARESMSRRSRWSPAIAIAHRSLLEGRVRAMLDARLNRNPLTTSAKFTIIIALAVTTLSLGAVSVSGTTAAPRSISDVVLTSPATLPIPSVNLDRRVPGTGAMPARQAGAAQTGAVIEGVLYDQFGGLLPGASVKLTGLRRGAAYSTVTDRGGAFAFRDLVADDYEMITELPGFTTVRNVIRAEPGSMVRRHITLPTGTISETVSVACSPSPDTSKRPTAPSAAVTPGVTQHPSAVQRGVEPKIPATFTGGIGGQIRAPRKLTHAWPRCPTGVAASTALVRLAGRIGIDGLITDLRDVSAQADPAYVASAMEAVRQWTFLPTLLNGAPIEVNITITVQYDQ